MSDYWSSELWRLFLILLASALIGMLGGFAVEAILLAALGYLGWHLLNLHRLERWLVKGRKYQPPESSGIWGDIFHLIYKLQKNNRKRKKRLASILGRFQEATHALPDATVVLTPGGEIEWFNQAAEKMLGLRPPADIGQRIDNLLRNPQFTAYLNSGETEEGLEIPSPLSDIQTLFVRIVPYGEQRNLLVARDVSQRIRLEQVRRDFVANVSHELRTPLTVVNGYLETMRDSGDPGLQSWQQALSVMEQQSLRMKRIVDDLLLLSRLENGSTSGNDVVDVPAMLASIREGAEMLATEKNLTVHLKADRSLNIVGTESELYSAFNNLVGNAVRYTPEGGEITIRWYSDSEGIKFEVSDTGVGIAPRHIPRLTERFYRVDVARSRDSGGTGLGLAIVKHVLLRHHATLKIESRLGIGSTFICLFPQSAQVKAA